MDTSVEFSTAEADPLTDIPMCDLSAVIHTLLPIRLIGWKAVKRHYESVMACLLESQTDETKENFDLIVTGSTAEGYGLPLSTMRTYPSTVEVLFDVDMLFVHKNIPVSTVKIEESSDTAKAYLEYENVHPGYARICIPQIKKKDSAFIFDEKLGRYYLSSINYLRNMYSTHDKWNLEETTETTVQGPALSFDDKRTITEATIHIPNVGISKDVVNVLPCAPWPDIANDIAKRTAGSEWPQSCLIESIMNDGCHITAVPSKKSENPELEWRLSFSASEGRLAREAVTDFQRQCYIYMKILRYQAFKSKSILSSYVFKSVFLHCCEQLPVHHWKQFPGNCVLYMLDVLLECLLKKHVPTYFLPENNLIDHLSEDELNTAVEAAQKLRLDPVTPVLEFMDDKMFTCHCALLPFRVVIKPLLQDIEEYKQHRNVERSFQNGVFGTYYCLCMALLMENTPDEEVKKLKYEESVRYAIDLYTYWIEPCNRFKSVLGFVNSFALGIHMLDLAVKFFEGTVSLSTEYPEFLTIRGNLACMYHSMAYKHQDGSDLRKGYLQKAGDMFEQIYSENKASSIDYVTYLVKQKNFERAEQILEDIMEGERNTTDASFVYDYKEMETLDEPLKKLVLENGKIEYDTLSLAYFYMAKCLCSKERTPSVMSAIKSLLDKFQVHCETINRDDLFTLLQLTKELAA